MNRREQNLSAVPPGLIIGAVKGVGKIVGGAPDEVKWAYPSCGKKPFFTFTQKHKNWVECVQNQKQLDRNALVQSNSGGSGIEQENFFTKNKKWLIPVGIGVAGLIAYKLIKK